MADPRAFLSFDFDHDETPKILFAGQAKSDSPTPFTVEDWSSKRALPELEWEKLIAAKIKNCHLLIVLVGKNMGAAYGVAAEIAMAKEADVPVIGVYVNGADSDNAHPLGLQKNRTMKWDWDLIAGAVDQCLGEGKNA
jgi:hypothetical protein